MSIKSLPDHKRLALNATLADLRVLSETGIALCRGEASTWEDQSMAKACAPGKTKALAPGDRGFRNFQSVLDRAANLLKEADTYDTFHAKRKDLAATDVPMDHMIRADSHTDECKGQSALANAMRTLNHARSVYMALKAKFGERLHAPATLTLNGDEKKRKSHDELAAARKAIAKRAEIGKTVEALDESQRKLLAAVCPALAALLGAGSESAAAEGFAAQG